MHAYIYYNKNCVSAVPYVLLSSLSISSIPTCTIIFRKGVDGDVMLMDANVMKHGKHAVAIYAKWLYMHSFSSFNFGLLLSLCFLMQVTSRAC